jgi:thioredoxin 1
MINDPSRPALVLFDLGWAGPGRRLEERLLQLAEKPLMNMARVDVGRLPELAQRFGVHGAPALILFRSGQVAARRLGEIADGDLKDWLASELTA